MRLSAIIGLLALSACALSPGQLDPIKVEAHDSCVQVVIEGNPVAGQSTATFTPTIPAGAGLGVQGALATTATPTGVTLTCTVPASHHDISYQPPG